MQEHKNRLKEALERLYCVHSVHYVTLSPDAIRWYVDMDYRGDEKEVLEVIYEPECYALPKYLLHWESTTPQEARDELAI